MIGLTLSWHERVVAGRRDPGSCEIAVLPAYPYDCTAADKRPNDIVVECRTHGCWWTVDPATGSDPTERTN